MISYVVCSDVFGTVIPFMCLFISLVSPVISLQLPGFRLVGVARSQRHSKQRMGERLTYVIHIIFPTLDLVCR